MSNGNSATDLDQATAAGEDAGFTPRQHRRKAQENLREALYRLQAARTLLKQAEEHYGNNQGNLTLYRRKAEFYAGRVEEISRYVSEMIDPEAD